VGYGLNEGCAVSAGAGPTSGAMGAGTNGVGQVVGGSTRGGLSSGPGSPIGCGPVALPLHAAGSRRSTQGRNRIVQRIATSCAAAATAAERPRPNSNSVGASSITQGECRWLLASCISCRRRMAIRLRPQVAGRMQLTLGTGRNRSPTGGRQSLWHARHCREGGSTTDFSGAALPHPSRHAHPHCGGLCAPGVSCLR
jgi:hypothetical protein